MATDPSDVAAPVRVGRELTAVATACGLELTRYVEGRDGRVALRPRATSSWRPRYVHLVGRDRELAMAGDTIREREVVEFAGEPGIGKTALLRSVATQVGEDGPPVIKPAPGSVDDVLTSLVRHFWESDGRPYVVTPDLCEELLADAQAVVLLDQPPFSEDDLHAFLDTAPQCAVVVTSRRRVLRGRGPRSQTLTGLEPDSAVALFEDELGRPLPEGERAEARTLCELLDGFPWHVQRSAGLVKDGVVTTSELFAAVRAASARGAARQWVTERLAERLDEEQWRVIGVLERFDCRVHLRHFGVLAQLTNPAAVLESLEELGVIESHSPVYSLCGGRLRSRAEPPGPEALEEALQYLGGWAHEHRELADVLLEDAPLLSSALQLAVARRRRPREALRIARALDAALAPAGLWTAWGAVLTCGRQAARQAGDTRAEAWFLHQLGTRALCLGDRKHAIRDLRRAHAIRERASDAPGVAATLQNLGLAGAGPGRRWRRQRAQPAPSGGVLAPATPLSRGVLVPATEGASAGVPARTWTIAILGVFVAAAVGAVALGRGSPAYRAEPAALRAAAAVAESGKSTVITLRNPASGRPVELDDVTLAGSLVARIEDNECSGELSPGQTCDVRVSVPKGGRPPTALKVASDGGRAKTVRISRPRP